MRNEVEHGGKGRKRQHKAQQNRTRPKIEKPGKAKWNKVEQGKTS